MHTSNCYGGVTIGALQGSRLVGYSYGMPGFDGGPFLLSCGLAVSEGHRGRGIGEALKLAQAQEARRTGYRLIRWTTGSLASGPLRLYLTKLGARLVGLHEDFYGEVRPVQVADEVEIEWDLCVSRRRMSGYQERVEIPWRAGLVVDGEVDRWVRRVRGEMRDLLAKGYVGTGVTLESDAQRSFVVFQADAGRS